MQFDGIVADTGGVSYPGTVYPIFRSTFNQRIDIPSPLEITLNCTYDSVANSGIINATILNTTVGAVNGALHFAIIESEIPYYWQGLTELNFVMRDMLPDASGEAVAIPASDTIMRSRNFTTNTSWNELNCRIVVFVQGATKEMYQGAEIGLIQEPEMVYYGLLPIETNGNGNGIAEPGESMEFKVAAKNMGTGIYDGTAAVQCISPYITITGATPALVSIGVGDIDTVITFAVDIDLDCPNPHATAFELDFGSPVDNVPFVITTKPGFSDNIESGQGNWTHSGLRDYWHITEHKSNSPTHAWYFGFESSWVYTINCDGSLVTPYFVAPPDSPLYFYHQYSLETNWDYGYVEIDNGSGWWQTLGRFTGTLNSWTQVSYPLSSYAGQTVRLRFRFLSDQSVNQEGWYVDDISIPTLIGVREFSSQAQEIISLNVYPNPFRQMTEIRFQVQDAGCKMQDISLKIYDISGRVVKSFDLASDFMAPSSAVFWSGDDELGRKVPAGIYFVKLNNTQQSLIEKVIYLR